MCQYYRSWSGHSEDVNIDGHVYATNAVIYIDKEQLNDIHSYSEQRAHTLRGAEGCNQQYEALDQKVAKYKYLTGKALKQAALKQGGNEKSQNAYTCWFNHFAG